MLRDLTIRNLAIVEDLSLELGPGFTAITGETGAGKSILVDALSLLSGGRASADLLRHEADRLTVSARFDGVDGRPLEEAGIAAPDGEIVVRREIGADGKGRAFVNDAAVAAKTLAAIGERLVAIHGQGGERRLLDADAALDLVDAFGALEESADEVARRAREFREAEGRREELAGSRRDRDRRLDLLGFEIAEIDAARLEGLDEDVLATERNLLLHADRVRQLGEAAAAALSEDEGSALDRIGEAHRAASELARIDGSFAEVEAEIAEIKARASDVASQVAGAAARIEADPERLAEAEDRLARLARLKKKYGASVAEILAWREKSAAERDTLENLDDSLDELARRGAAALAAYEAAARSLSDGRRESARKLSAAVQKSLAELAMEKAKFRVELAETEERVSPRGRERAEILFSGNPGEPERPLAKIASGGELSRVQLAIESVLLAGGRVRGRARGRTLVFDEVDAGIGGRIAEVVARKLASLSTTDQVLCVTHVPQIAARAGRHLRAVKKVAGGRTRAGVEELTGDERVEEIARMLAGATVTPTARAHARALLAAR
ncbi:MAG TPA: DNA repair protein RecN [Thermoanaerobaculia bacterium]|nr:DNA repair protein RecN [Thermoanaerobaculia bacterium]